MFCENSGRRSPSPRLWKALVVGWRVLRLTLLSVGIVAVWCKTDYPWDEGCRAYVWLNVALGVALLVRLVRWPGFLWLVFLTWFLAAANWRQC
jgi:hypothetical protein